MVAACARATFFCQVTDMFLYISDLVDLQIRPQLEEGHWNVSAALLWKFVIEHFLHQTQGYWIANKTTCETCSYESDTQGKSLNSSTSHPEIILRASDSNSESHPQL